MKVRIVKHVNRLREIRLDKMFILSNVINVY